MHIINPYRFSTVANTTLKTGLVSCWELNESSGATATDANGAINLSYNGNPSYSQTTLTNLGTSISLDASDDYIGSSTSTSLRPTSSTGLSISLWMRPADVSSYHGGFGMSLSGYARGYILDYTYQSINFQVGYNSSWAYATSNSAPSNDTWYHCVGTWDGSKVRIYVNGTLGTRQDNQTNIDYTSTTFEIGRYPGNNGNKFSGKVDQVAVWSKVLSSDEVNTLYNSGNGLAYTSW